MGCASSKPSRRRKAGTKISHPYHPTPRSLGPIPDAHTRRAAKYARPPPPPPQPTKAQPKPLKRKPVAPPPAHQIAYYSAKPLPKPQLAKMPVTKTVPRGQAKTQYVKARQSAHGTVCMTSDGGLEKRAKNVQHGKRYVRARESKHGGIWLMSSQGEWKRAKDCRDGVWAEGLRVEWYAKR